MVSRSLSVSRPRVVAVRRRDPNRVSIGDEAVVEFGPGLPALLDLAVPAGQRLGESIAPEWSMPFGAAGTAAVYVSNPAGHEDRHSWTLATCTVRSSRAVRAGETLLAHSRIEALGRTSVTHAYRVTSRDGGDLVADGTMVIVSLGPGGPRPFEAELYPASPPPGVLPRDVAPKAPSASDAVARENAPAGVLARIRSRISGKSSAVTAEPTAPALAWEGVPGTLVRGERAAIAVTVRNDGPSAEVVLAIEAPRGHGLDFRWDAEARFSLGRGESRTCSGELRALRSHEVNLGRPWTLRCTAAVGAVSHELAAEVEVADPVAGRIFYVLTEDCETFDGGEKTGTYGDRAALGNCNNVMDPEDYRIQMIEKPAALNRIAERHGARWTHFWTVPQRFAAAWAAGRSKTGAWDVVVSDLDRSVREGSLEHEYAPHIHFDFEPDSALPPQPRLVYDPATDGLLPNEYYDPAANPEHRYHGWDGARKGIAYVRDEGRLDAPDTKAGSLRRSVRYLARAAFGRTLSLTLRTGACDFGGTAEDLGKSARALLANGLHANADAGHYEHAGEHPRGRQLYFCRADDLELEIADLADASLVQLRAPEIQIDGSSLEECNAWFDRRVAASRGPGVRAIAAMTHAMFMKGSPDPYRDVTGGDFEKLDRHLEYVRTRYPEVRFATASEAVLEFLDYSTPEPLAVCVAPRAVSRTEGRVIFPIRILGDGIPISHDRPARLRVQAPPSLDPERIRTLRVLERGVAVALAESGSRPDRLPHVEFTARGFDGYELEAMCSDLDLPSLDAGAEIGSATDGYEEAVETRRSTLARVEWPRVLSETRSDPAALRAGDEWEWIFPADLFRLLVNPVSGEAEPIARRTHPYAVQSLGAGMHAALSAAPAGFRPKETVLECTAAVAGRAAFRVVCRVERVDREELAFESRVFEAGALIARVRTVLVPGPSGEPAGDRGRREMGEFSSIAGTVRLRNVERADSSALYRWRMDSSSRPNFRSTEPVSFEAHETFLARYLSPETRDRWFVVEADGAPVGAIALYGFSADGSEAEWGRLVVDPAARGHGHGRKAVELLIDRAREIGVRRLRCEVIAGNARAESIYQRLGFVEAGRETIDGRIFRYLAREL